MSHTLARRQSGSNLFFGRPKTNVSSCVPQPWVPPSRPVPPGATSPPATFLDLGALFAQRCAATTHVLLHSKAMWQIYKSMYVSECWKRALILLAAKLTLLLSSERGPQHSSVPQTQTLPGFLPAWQEAASLRVRPRQPLREGQRLCRDARGGWAPRSRLVSLPPTRRRSKWGPSPGSRFNLSSRGNVAYQEGGKAKGDCQTQTFHSYEDGF